MVFALIFAVVVALRRRAWRDDYSKKVRRLSADRKSENLRVVIVTGKQQRV